MSLEISNSLQKYPTQSLNSMLFIKNTILNTIYENEGEISSEEDDELTRLDIHIPLKVDAWAWLLMNDGGIDKEIELLTDRKKAIEETIRRLKQTKDNLKAKAHNVLKQHNLDRVDGHHFWIKKDFSKTSKVILSKVEEEYKTYQLPKLSHHEYQLVLEALNKLNEVKECDDPDLLHLQTRLTNQVDES